MTATKGAPGLHATVRPDSIEARYVETDHSGVHGRRVLWHTDRTGRPLLFYNSMNALTGASLHEEIDCDRAVRQNKRFTAQSAVDGRGSLYWEITDLDTRAGG